jgi:hypothetical protein
MLSKRLCAVSWVRSESRCHAMSPTTIDPAKCGTDEEFLVMHLLKLTGSIETHNMLKQRTCKLS